MGSSEDLSSILFCEFANLESGFDPIHLQWLILIFLVTQFYVCQDLSRRLLANALASMHVSTESSLAEYPQGRSFAVLRAFPAPAG